MSVSSESQKSLNHSKKIKFVSQFIWLARWDDFRTLKWVDSVKCPELILGQVRQLLQLSTL